MSKNDRNELDSCLDQIKTLAEGVPITDWAYTKTTFQAQLKLNTNGTLKRRYVYGTKSNVPDYFIEGSQKYRIISDHLGSPRQVIRLSDGLIVHEMDHDEFGRVVKNAPAGYLPFGYAGGLYDAQTGLVRFGARDYDPEIGRWTSKDPIGFRGGDTNLFGYVANDPVNWIDPSGLYQVCTKPLQRLNREYGPFYHQFLCANGVCGGQNPSGSIGGSPGQTGGEDASGPGVSCKDGPEEPGDKKNCMDACIADAIEGPRPYYRVISVGGGVNCQSWANDTVANCAARCGGK